MIRLGNANLGDLKIYYSAGYRNFSGILFTRVNYIFSTIIGEIWGYRAGLLVITLLW